MRTTPSGLRLVCLKSCLGCKATGVRSAYRSLEPVLKIPSDDDTSGVSLSSLSWRCLKAGMVWLAWPRFGCDKISRVGTACCWARNVCDSRPMLRARNKRRHLAATRYEKPSQPSGLQAPGAHKRVHDIPQVRTGIVPLGVVPSYLLPSRPFSIDPTRRPKASCHTKRFNRATY